MSELSASQCGCCNESRGGSNCGCSSWIWIILLLVFCGGCGGSGHGRCDNDCGFFGGNNGCCEWIIILLILSCCCGDGHGFF